MGRLSLVLGGARSGKTHFAQRLAQRAATPVVYVATAEASDAEMVARIQRHRADRPATWRTIEVTCELDAGIAAVDDESCLLIDCLSIWLSNELLANRDWPSEGDTLLDLAFTEEIERRLVGAVERLADLAVRRAGSTIVVSNEVGSGLVPTDPLGRLYRDLLGRVNQVVAARSSATYLVVAGIGVELRRLAVEFGAAEAGDDPDR